MSSSNVRPVAPDRRLVVFLVIAFGVPWLLWLLRESTGVDVIAIAGMAAAGLAVLAATWPPRSAAFRATGVLPVRPFGTTMRETGFALGVFLALTVAAILVGALAGISPLDLDGLSGARQLFDMADAPAVVVLARALGQSILLAVLLVPFAFCEEWAWRGYLLPRLLPLGVGVALPLSGLIWGLWHLPGYVGSGARPGFVPFLIYTVVFGVLMGWLRLRSRSIWPVTVVHAANNTIVTGFVNVAFVDAGALTRVDPWSFGFSGWPGWLVTGVLIATLILARRFPRRADRAAEPGNEWRGLRRRG